MSSSEKQIRAGVVISDGEGRYLLVQEKKARVFGLWNLPAGHVEAGESAPEAAVREAGEEIGLEVELESKEPLYSSVDNTEGVTLIAFLGTAAGGEFRYDPLEILDARYLTIAEIERLFARGQIRTPWVLESIRQADAHHRR